MKKITLMGGIACLAISLTFLSSCKKEAITSKQSSTESGNHAGANQSFKYSAVAKVPGENPENGFLLLKVSSDDETFMKKYVAKLEQTKIVMQEANSTSQDEKDMKPLFDEKESASPVGIDFNWENFKFNREKGKLYKVCAQSTDASKSLVYYTAFTASQFNSGWTWATVNVYNTFYRNLASNVNNCTWYFNNTVNYFYNKQMSYHDNLEIRCFQNSTDNSTVTIWNDLGFPYFTINGISTYYSARFNYQSPPMPTPSSRWVDVNAIYSGYGYSNAILDYTPAQLTFYIAG